VHNAHLLAQAMALAAQLQTALSTRPVIDQAIGLLRGRTGRSAEDAFAQLRAISQAERNRTSNEPDSAPGPDQLSAPPSNIL